MKKIALLLMTLVLATSAFAQKKQLTALFGYSTFYIPGSDQPYVETYLDFDARTLNFVKFNEDTYSNQTKDQYRATVEVVLLVSKNDTVAYIKKYDLNSPVTNSDTNNRFTFLDLQRFGLSNGIYDMQVSLRDKNSEAEAVVFKDMLVVFYQNGKPAMSNIQLMSSATPTTTENMLSRNGFDMVPYINDFLPAEIKQLNPYIEIYNLDKEIGDKSYIMSAYLIQTENGRRIEGFETYSHRKQAKAMDAVYMNLDIAKLPSGNYTLVVEAMNLANQVLMRKTASFQRSNPGIEDDLLAEANVAASFAGRMTDEEELTNYIDALYPIASAKENTMLEALGRTTNNLVEKQTFFYRFWVSRNALNPEKEWLEYREKVQYVDKNFGYPRTPGHRTDRGRVYLQYGAPDFIRDEKNFVGALHISNSPVGQTDYDPNQGYVTSSSRESLGTIHYLPYQLWRYNRMPADNPNRVFIFWDEFRSGYYKLLNSNARGELRTAFWERMLSQNQLDENVKGEVGEQFERGY